MADLSFSLDSTDPSSFDTGLADSAVDYSGSTTDPSLSDVVGSDPSLDGSSIDFNSDSFSTSPDLTLLDQQAITGVTDPAPDPTLDTGTLDTSGGGSADSQDVGAGTPTSSFDWGSALSTFGKFGAGMAAVITGNPVQTVQGQVIGARGSVAYDAQGRPIVQAPRAHFSMSSKQLAIVLAVFGGLAVYLAFQRYGK